MSRDVKQPIGQKRLTNIASVRYKKMGKRFEIACYKNTVVNWRDGVEKDINEVVQTTTVFSNVSKGVLAKREDLQAVFATDDEEAICRIILSEGDFQVSDKERKVHYDALFKDVANVLVDKCVNPETNRPYTSTMLERALRDAHFAVDPKRSAKQQALEAIPILQSVIPLRRADMRLKIQVAPAAEHELELLLREHGTIIERQEVTAKQVTVVCLAAPGWYRGLHSFVQNASGGGGRLEVLSLAASEESDARPSIQQRKREVDGIVEGVRYSSLGNELPSAARTTTPASEAQQPRQQYMHDSTRSVHNATTPTDAASSASQGELLYSGDIDGLPDEHASRRERFAELDELQSGWQVELRRRGETVAALFLSPSGASVGSYALARRQALAAKKAAAS